MEIVVALFICLWLTVFAVWGYVQLKKDYKDVMNGCREDKEK